MRRSVKREKAVGVREKGDPLLADVHVFDDLVVDEISLAPRPMNGEASIVLVKARDATDSGPGGPWREDLMRNELTFDVRPESHLVPGSAVRRQFPSFDGVDGVFGWLKKAPAGFDPSALVLSSIRFRTERGWDLESAQEWARANGYEKAFASLYPLEDVMPVKGFDKSALPENARGAFDALEKERDAATARAEKAEAEAKEARASAEKIAAERDALKAKVDPAASERAAIEKAVADHPHLKAVVEKAERLEREMEHSKAVSFAKAYPGTDHDAVAGLVQRLRARGDAEGEAALKAVLDQAKTYMEKSAAFKEVGGAGRDVNDPESKIEALAREAQKADPKLTFQKAYDAVLETAEGRALYAQIRDARAKEAA